MPRVTIDHLYYQRELIRELVAILIDGEYKTVKWIDQGSRSIQFMVSHSESEIIGRNLLNQFHNICAHPIHQHPIPNDQFQQIRLINKYDLGPLNQFQDFIGLIEDDVQLSLIIDNHYHLEGQLEISLALSINRGGMVVFDKWSTSKSKNCFNEIRVQVNPRVNNFSQRDALLNNLSNEAFTDFRKSMNELKNFLRTARYLTLNGETLRAVYLDLIGRNRSLTSLMLSKENRLQIKYDLNRVSKFVRRRDFVRGRNQEGFSYVDFIRIIAKSPPQFHYNPQFEFEITTSRAYNSLLKKQKIFSDRNDQRFPYEEEQLQTLNEINRVFYF